MTGAQQTDIFQLIATEWKLRTMQDRGNLILMLKPPTQPPKKRQAKTPPIPSQPAFPRTENPTRNVTWYSADRIHAVSVQSRSAMPSVPNATKNAYQRCRKDRWQRERGQSQRGEESCMYKDVLERQGYRSLLGWSTNTLFGLQLH